MSSDYGYLEFLSSKRGTPPKYFLKKAKTTIGSALTNDIRLKRISNSEPSLCVIEAKRNGSISLECSVPNVVSVNGARVRTVSKLKPDDVIEVCGKTFKYINSKPSAKNTPGSKTKRRQSVMPNFKLKSTSKVPVETKCAKTRKSLSLHSPVQTKSITKRLCNSAIIENRRRRCLDPDEWTTTKTPNLILNKPSVSTSRNQKRISIRKSLFLKSKIDISINDSLDISSPLIDFNSFTSFDDDQTAPDFKAITPSSTSVVRKGIKRNRETISDTSMKACKRPRYSSVEPAEEKSFSEPRRSQRKRSYSTYGFDESEYDLSGIKSLLSTPNEMGKKSTPSLTKIPLNDLSNNKLLDASQTRILYSSPLNDLSDVEGVETLFKTPSIKKTPKSAKKKLNAQNDPTDVRSVKKLMKTPKIVDSPVNDLTTNIAGVKKLFKTPGEKSIKSPLNDLTKVQGVKTLFKTPLNDLSRVSGVKKIIKTPREQKSPVNDLTKVYGVKKLFNTPKENKSPLNDLTDIRGVKRILKTPKPAKSPKNDLTNVAGVKKMFATLKTPKSPLNDLTDVAGVKRVFKTPKVVKEPLNDLSDVEGVADLLKSPGNLEKVSKDNKKRKSDLTNGAGVKKPKTPKSPLNDLTDVAGVKRVFKTPKVVKEPLNDLSDVEGVAGLLKTPENFEKVSSNKKRSLNLISNESPLVQVSSGRATRNKRRIVEVQEDAVKTEIKTRSRRAKVNDDTTEQAKTEESPVVKKTRSRAKKPKNSEEEAMDGRDEKVNDDNKFEMPQEKKTKSRKRVNNEESPIKKTRSRAKKPKNTEEEDANDDNEPQAKTTKSRKRVNDTSNADAESPIKKTRTRAKKTKNTEEKESEVEERKPRIRKNVTFDDEEEKPATGKEKKSRTKKNQTSAEEAIEVPEKKKRARKNVKTEVDDEKEENVKAIEEPRYNTRRRNRT